MTEEEFINAYKKYNMTINTYHKVFYRDINIGFFDRYCYTDSDKQIKFKYYFVADDYDYKIARIDNIDDLCEYFEQQILKIKRNFIIKNLRNIEKDFI